MLDLAKLSSEAQEKHRKKPKPAKPIRPNDDVEVYYRKHLASLVRAMDRSVEQWILPALKQAKPAYTADAWSDDIEDAINAAAVPFSAAAIEATYQRLASEVVERTVQQTTASLVNSVNRSVGVNLGPIFEQQPMREYMDIAINENVSLIRSISEQHFKNVRTVVYQGVAGKTAPTTIAQRLQEETGVSERRAKLIARDQTSKITSQVTQRRQEQAGIRYYRSIDAGDERVSGRPGGRYPNAKISCWGIARRDIGFGKGVYKVSEGAEWAGEKNLHPGRHHVACRCTASPVFEWEVEERRAKK